MTVAPPPVRPSRFGPLGLRAQIALALVAVLALAMTMALLAIRPLTAASTRATRRQTGVALARAVAGQVALMPADADVRALVDGAVGPGALAGACVLDPRGRARASAGSLATPWPRAPFEDAVRVRGDEALEVVVALPARGAFVADVSLAQTPAERALRLAILLYTAVASGAALWAVFVLLTRYTVRPVEALTRAAERVAAGRRDAVAHERGAAEVVRAARAFNAMTRQLASREEDLSRRVAELEHATRELATAQDQLVRTERLAVVGRLAAGIAHEIGNPLAAIVGLTDVLADGDPAPDEVKDFAGRIGKEAQRIHRTIRDLLDYARAAPTTRPTEPGDVADAVAQVVRLLGPQKAMRAVALDVQMAATMPAVALDHDRLVQVLLNLVLNAADATRTQDGARITLRGAREGDTVAIEVEDNGPGISTDLRARVFEPFFTTKPAGEGTGLGLAICASVVEAVGGRVEALDRRDGTHGARVRVVLPV